MRSYTLTHLSDAVLLRDLAALVAQDRLTTATLLAHVAEVDTRRLYVPAGFPSMHAYCVDELRLSEDSELPQHAPGHVGSEATAVLDTPDEHAPGHVEDPQVEMPHHSPDRFLVQLTIAKSTHDKLRYAQALLSHALPTGDLAQVLDRALDALIAQLEKRKFGATTAPRRMGRPKSGITLRPQRQLATVRKRYVPAHVRRAVWERDQGQCTFVSASGTRCKARKFLEFDHIDPVARGGHATVDKMRLRCRAHNQYEAERAFGAGFMSRKRHEARLAAAEARARAAAKEQAAREQIRDVVAGLLNLGCRADEARRAAEFARTLQDATLEERMRAALKFLSRGSIQVSGSAGG
jgi:5-methylcytosine-specific restriction endonuclease McrA